MDAKVRCPECGTMQEGTQPFCENCGYRLRSQKTALEGLPSITPDMLRSAGPIRPERVTTAQTDVVDQEPEEEDIALEAQEELEEGFAPEMFSTEERLRKKGPRQTLEEAPAITTQMLESISKQEEIPAPSATSTSGIMAAPPSLYSETKERLIFAIVLVASVSVAVLTTYFFVSHSKTHPNDPNQPGKLTPYRKIKIESGTYIRGLTEETRAYLLRACLRISENPDDECEQDRLLKGEYPDTKVDVPTFWIDSHEVTVARYQQCINASKCEEPDYKHCKVYTQQGLQVFLRVPKALQEMSKPQVCVSHQQASAYCTYSGGTLPSEDQWEKAARGTEGNLFPWGESWDPINANWGEFDMIKTPVGGKIDGAAWTSTPGTYPKGKSPFEVEDMAGNVYEWVTKSGESTTSDARGGAWTSNPFELRTTSRLEVKADLARTDVGFRCVYEK